MSEAISFAWRSRRAQRSWLHYATHYLPPRRHAGARDCPSFRVTLEPPPPRPRPSLR